MIFCRNYLLLWGNMFDPEWSLDPCILIQYHTYIYPRYIPCIQNTVVTIGCGISHKIQTKKKVWKLHKFLTYGILMLH
jgi:hypothetical protein